MSPPIETLATLLDDAAARFPRLRLHSFFRPAAWSSGELLERAGRIAAGLFELGVHPGDRVGVLLPTSLELLATYFGVFRAGAVLVPFSVPMGMRDVEPALTRLRGLGRHSGVRVLVTDPLFLAAAAQSGLDVAATTPESLLASEARAPVAAVAPGDLALIQYTSGSTASPKGVALTHGQVVAGVWATALGGRLNEADVYCSWLPMSHDMGIMSTIAHVMAGADVHLSPPSDFIKKPREWLEHFARVRGTVYAAPSFSYQYLLDAVDDELLDRLDLSPWRLALNGSEMVDAVLMERFVRRFARAGFRRETMFPVYGLAEATVGVTFPEPGEGPVVEWVDRHALSNRRIAESAPPDAPETIGVVGVGRPLPGLELRIVGSDPPGTLAERCVGEIEVRGASTMSGYHGETALSAEAFHDDWLRTGDLGYLSGGRLFVTGRIKEVMKLLGDSYFPEDIEALVRDVPGVHRRRCVAFVRVDPPAERMVLLVETELANPDEQKSLGAEIRRRVRARLAADVLDVYLVAPRSILRTTSGKYQRLAMRGLVSSGAIRQSLVGVH